MGTVAKLVISLDANTGEYIAKLRDAEQKTHGFVSGLQSVGNAALGMFTGGLMLQSAEAIGGALVHATQQAATFETTLNRFRSVTGLSSEEIQQFNMLAMEMGAKTQFSAAEAAQAMVELAKGGIEPASIAAGTLEQTLNLAAAGELKLSKAAEITSKQLGIWASNGTSAADVANLMTQAANASTVDVDELALGMANVGSVAKVAGLSFQETVTTMAMLAPGFSSAADAGTSLKTFLNNLVPTSKTAISVAQELGLVTVDKLGNVKSAFYDASGQFVGMHEAARILHDATKHLTAEQKALALQTIFGTDAQRAAAIIAEAGAEGYIKMTGAMQHAGSATEQAAMRNQGLAFALESFKGSLETLAIMIGQKFLPVATQIIHDFFIPAANQVIENWPQISATVDDVFRFIAAVWENTLRPVLSALLIIAKDIVTWIIANWPQIRATVEPVLRAIVDFIRDPVIPTIGALIRAGMDVINWFAANFPRFRTIVEHVINDTIEFFASVPAKFLSFGQAIVNGLVRGVQENIHHFRNVLFGWLPKWAKDALGLSSPSRVFMYYGRMSAMGYMLGFAEAFRAPMLTPPIFNYALGVLGAGAQPITININGNVQLRNQTDLDELADAITERLRYRSR